MSESHHERGSLSAVPGYRMELLLSKASAPALDQLRETLQRLDPLVIVEAGRATFPTDPASTIEWSEATSTGDIDSSLSQTWDWPGAGHAVTHAHGRLAVRERGETVVSDRFERLRRFNVVVRGLVEHAPVVALHWRMSGRVVEPAVFIERLAHGSSVTDHAVNVRLFRVPDGEDGETIMDTLGLTAFGLPDLQVHFARLDPMAVAPVLLHYAEYVFDKGDILDDEDLIRGIEAYDEWLCRRQTSLAPPERAVIDIHPADYAVSHE